MSYGAPDALQPLDRSAGAARFDPRLGELFAASESVRGAACCYSWCAAVPVAAEVGAPRPPRPRENETVAERCFVAPERPSSAPSSVFPDCPAALHGAEPGALDTQLTAARRAGPAGFNPPTCCYRTVRPTPIEREPHHADPVAPEPERAPLPLCDGSYPPALHGIRCHEP